jgi:hypothetical protein
VCAPSEAAIRGGLGFPGHGGIVIVIVCSVIVIAFHGGDDGVIVDDVSSGGGKWGGGCTRQLSCGGVPCITCGYADMIFDEIRT